MMVGPHDGISALSRGRDTGALCLHQVRVLRNLQARKFLSRT
jgi:hypothetical protein